MAQNFPIAEKFTRLLHAHVAPHSNPPNFRMHLNVANNLDFYSPEKQFQNQLTKVSNYKQAASTRCGPTGIQDWSWDPRRRGKCRAQSTLGKNTHLGSENQHTVGKSTGLFCWLVISLGPTNQPLKFTLEKQGFISWFHLAYGLGNLELSPENRLVFIKLANAYSLEHTEERVQCRNTQGLWSTLSFTRIHYSRNVSCGLGETHTLRLISFFIFS